MTLLTTEIAVDPEPAVVFAADRRLSINGMRDVNRRKILDFPARRLGIGYFGLAELPRIGNRRRFMDEWLGDFMSRHSAERQVGNLAAMLATELNQVVPESLRSTEVSGFHLAGLRSADDAPEFWAVSNRTADWEIDPHGYSAHDFFQGEHAALLPSGHVQTYRNGDIRVHSQTWTLMDDVFSSAFQLPGFVALRGPRGHMLWVRYKMEAIVRLYEEFSEPDIIGRPVDAFVITRTGIEHPGRRRPRPAPTRRRRI